MAFISMLSGAGRNSSQLDYILPERWTSQLTEQLLELSGF